MAAATCTNTPHAQSPSRKRGFSVLSWIGHALQTRRERKVLANMNTAQLNDIGLTPSQAHREAQKPIWDVPAHWLC